MSTWLRRVWHLLNRRRHERELVNEMNEHRASMHDPSKFGDAHRLLERSRDEWGWNWLDDAMQDLAVGIRMLMRSPAFAITSVLILSFGIGLNVTLFQVTQVALLRPPAIKDSASWVRFLRASPNSTTSSVPYPLAQYVKDHNSVFDEVVVEYGSNMAWGRAAGEQVNADFVSSNWFSALGYGAEFGRVLSDAIDTGTGAPAVVLSHTFWKTRLGADPNVVGTIVYIDRRPVTIAGVAAAALPGFDFSVADVFLPIVQREYFYPESPLLRAWNDDGVDIYAKLKPGVPAAQAREAMRSTMQAIASERSDVDNDEWLEPLLATHNFMRDSERYAVLAVVSLMGALTALVLIVAAANLGNLVLSRAAGRVRELGVRMALGARRTRIVRQLIIESLPLAILGVAGSVGFAEIAINVIARFAELPAYFNFGIDWQGLSIAIALGALVLLVVGVVPAWKVAQQHLTDAVKDGGQQVSTALDRALMRRVMVAAQVAGSCLLLVVAGMMVRSLQSTIRASMGFEYQRGAVLSVPLERYGAVLAKPEAARSYWYAVKERVRGNPEVEEAAIVTAAPLGGRMARTRYDATPGIDTIWQSVDPEYFAVMRIPLLAGRVFAPGETKTAIVSRRLALEMYGSLDVLGREFPKGAAEATIIGVAADAHAIKVEANNVVELYLPLQPKDFSQVYLVARARADVDRVLPVLREAAVTLDSRVIPTATAMRDDFDQQMFAPRVASTVAALVGGLTLALACLGIFGVVSYGVALRMKEIGIRVALGAPQQALLRAIVRQVLTPVGAGAVIGLVLAVPTGLALHGEPFYLESADPIAFTSALVIFAGCGGIAALMPAVKALKADPVRTLRRE